MRDDQPFEALGHDGELYKGSYRIEKGTITVRDAKTCATERTRTGGDPDLVLARKMLLNLNGRPWAVYGFSPMNGVESHRIPQSEGNASGDRD